MNANLNEDGSIKGLGKTDYNFNYPEAIFDGADWHERKPNQPFYAQLMISVTHRGPVWKKRVQEHQPQINLTNVKLPVYYPDHPIAREDWATYLKSIQLMDTYVGNVLAGLKAEGLDNNTVVIFSSDHGRCMVRDKQFLYDGGIKVPFIIKWSGVVPERQVDADLHSTIDVTATILNIAGVKIPSYMEGRNFLGNDVKNREYIIAARDRMDETVDQMRAVRDKQFKYIRNKYPGRAYTQPNKYKENEYPVWNLLKDLKVQGKLTPQQLLFTRDTKPAEELYDIIKDPDEINNLAANRAYKKQLQKMRSILDGWTKETGDKGK